jgi:hypothetical protein
MASTSKFFGKFFLSLGNKEVDCNSDTFKMVLLNDSWTPDEDNAQYYADISEYEITGDGYTTGGVTIANFTDSYNSTTHVYKIDGDDVTIPNSTLTAKHAVVVDDTPATNKPLVSYQVFDSNKSSSGSDFVVQWGTDGIATITLA